MLRFDHRNGTRRNLLLSAAGLLAAAVPALFGLVSPTPINAQAPTQAQAPAPSLLAYEYEVVAIKENKSAGFPSATTGDDGFTAKNIPLQLLIAAAFGVGPDRLTGAPDWVNSEKYDVDAKIESSVSEALKKLSEDDRRIARQHMLLAVFEDRCKLKYRRETKELPVYTLVIAKNGPKFQESKPDETPPAGIKVPDGKGGTGTITVGARGAVTFHGLPLTVLVQMLTTQLGRTVVDKTGLTGKYDFTWQFVPDPSQVRAAAEAQLPGGGAGNASSQTLPSDPQGSSVFTAVQEQLGLKLDSGKGPVEIVIIEHIEKPSDN
jgi:uncharacterized protein (TIGR03435 family)